jgi:abequosyltransferase
MLSVCIPTYNFGPYIGETLESVLSQLTADVEVVVLDSGSTDQTTQVVSDLQSRHVGLRYERTATPCGIDLDLARVVELSRGRYCWLFSADDVMAAGSISRVLKMLESEHDVYVVQHSNETIAMQPLEPRHPVLRSDTERSFELSDIGQLRDYFERAETTEAFFSFMGGLIIRRGAWDRGTLNQSFVGSCWAHVVRLFEACDGGLRLLYVPRVMLRRRADNDSFATNGTVRRFALAIDGYLRIAEHFWGAGSDQAFHVRRVLRNEFRIGPLLYAKRKCAMHPALEDRKELNRLVAAICVDATVGCVVMRAAFHLVPAYAFAPLLTLRGLLRRVLA